MLTKTYTENSWGRHYHSNWVDIKEPKVGLSQPLGTACHSKTLQAAHLFQQAGVNKSRHRGSPEKEQCGVFASASVQEGCSSQTWLLGSGSAHDCTRGKRRSAAAEKLDLLLRL